MKCFKMMLVCVVAVSLGSCASGYKMIQPSALEYKSVKEVKGVKFEYKYDLLKKKYAKKEGRKDLRIVALKITNNSGRDLTFGKDMLISYENGNQINIVENEFAFKTLKQKSAAYLLYLLLTPINFRQSSYNGITYQEKTYPVGLILGPGLAAGNMIAAGSANKKFEEELLAYDLSNKVIKDGETEIGLISIQSHAYDALMLKID